MTKNMTRIEAETCLITKAWKDEGFRSQLLKNPKGTIEKELDIEFEADAEIVVHQETTKSWNIVLPLKTEEVSDETERHILVRDKIGTFYKIPERALVDFAIREEGELKSAADAWESEEADVEGQSWGCPRYSRPGPTTGVCSRRG